MAEFFVTNRKWIALAILAAGASAAWWSSHSAPRAASGPPAGEPLAWQDVPLEPAVSQPAWAVPSAIVGQIPAPPVAAPYAAQNPLEAPFPNDDGARPPDLGSAYPTNAPPVPSRTFRPEATRRTLLPEFESAGEGQSANTHLVRDGDTLASLAAHYLGDEALAEVIFEANRDRLRSADVLPIGLELRIPPAKPEAPLADDEPPAAAAPVAKPAPVVWPTGAVAAPEPPAVAATAGLAPIAPGQLRRDVPSITAPEGASRLPAASIARPAGTVGRTHVVRRGDTLGRIARDYYGDAKRWPEIFAANRAVLANPDRLNVGAELVIP